MKFLDSDDLYAALKGSTHDYECDDKDWLCLLGRYAFNFRKYFLDFEVIERGLTPKVKVLIHNYIETDDAKRVEFLNNHTFVLSFKNFEKNKMPYNYVDYSICDIDFIYSVADIFSFLFPESSEFDSNELFTVLLEVLGESKAWKSLSK